MLIVQDRVITAGNSIFCNTFIGLKILFWKGKRCTFIFEFHKRRSNIILQNKLTMRFSTIHIIFYCYFSISTIIAFHFKNHRKFDDKFYKNGVEIQKDIKKTLSTAIITLGLIFATDIDQSDALVGNEVFNEVWSVVNDNFVDKTYNGNNWNGIKKEYSEKLNLGANEHEITKKVLSLLGDKYTRLLDKEYFESIWKYDAIGVGLLFQSDPKVDSQMRVASPPISGYTSLMAYIDIYIYTWIHFLLC